MIGLPDLIAARKRIRNAVFESPCAYSKRLSDRTGCELWLKLENLQMTGSFKERGACNRLSTLDAQARRAGVLAASAGNHAQGVAYHAQRLGIACTIVMPVSTPLVKVEAVRGYGAEVILHGEFFEQAQREATRLQRERGLTLIHPFDDAAIIAGQGSVGLELLEQVPDVDAVVTPVGGGGLAAGIALAVKEQQPSVQLFGVQTTAMPSLIEAYRKDGPADVPSHRTLADGIAVPRTGALPFEVLRHRLDGIVAVDEEEIAEGILLLLEGEKTVAEGAGAVGLAALAHRRLELRGKRVAVVVSGGNIDVNLVSRVIDRGLVKSGRLARLRVMVRDTPGALASLLNVVAQLQANVLQVRHDRLATQALGETPVELVLEVAGFEARDALCEALRGAGFAPEIR